MASEGLAEELEAALRGQGLRVQSWDSEPAGELRAPVRLRRNVCYVVLAVFLNEQVSVRPLWPAAPPPHRPTAWAEARSQPRGNRGPTGRNQRFFVGGASQFCKALSY